MSLTLYGGGQTLEDVREIRDDQTLRAAIDLKPLPSSSAIGEWLKRMGKRGGSSSLTLHAGDTPATRNTRA